uniref:Uncharacterized protein n=1 Tax=Wuchereria bancrofti TaxID=6293 RepID=A0AAF5RT05_WUCBA
MLLLFGAGTHLKYVGDVCSNYHLLQWFPTHAWTVLVLSVGPRTLVIAVVHDGEIRERHVLIVHVRNIHGFSRDEMRMFEYTKWGEMPHIDTLFSVSECYS